MPTSADSIRRAKNKLIAKGVCAMDGSGDPDVEALFQRLTIAKELLYKVRNAQDPVIVRGQIQRVLEFL